MLGLLFVCAASTEAQTISTARLTPPRALDYVSGFATFALSHDAKVAAGIAANNRVYVYHAGADKRRIEVADTHVKHHTIALSPDGSRLAYCTSRDLVIHSTTDGVEILRRPLPKERRPLNCRFNLAGDQVALGTMTDAILIDIEGSTCELLSVGHAGNVRNVAFSKNSLRLISCSSHDYRPAILFDLERRERLRDLDGMTVIDSPISAGRVIARARVPLSFVDILFDPSEDCIVGLAIPSRTTSELWEWDYASGELRHRWEIPLTLNRVAFADKSGQLLVGFGDDIGTLNGSEGTIEAVCLIDMSTGKVVEKSRIDKRLTFLCVSDVKDPWSVYARAVSQDQPPQVICWQLAK